jgi:hypothetical protein
MIKINPAFMFIKMNTLLLFLSITVVAFGQPDRRIWLGEDVLTKYEQGELKRDSSDHYYSGFIRYRCDRFEFSSNASNEKTNRDGLLLSAKSTTNTSVIGQAVVHNDNDSCFIVFNAIIEQVRHGRSAATSVLNLFSKKEDKSPQDEPYTDIHHVSSSGWILFGNDSSAFTYFINYNKDRIKPGGWLVLHRDTIYVRPVAAQVKLPKGKKIKKPGYIWPEGLLLVKGETVIAALDQAIGTASDPFTVYIAKDLSERNKLVIAAFFISLPLTPRKLL